MADDSLPSSTDAHVSLFDKISEHVSDFAGQKYFFFACIATIVIWLPSYPLFKDMDTWQLPINTFTTIVTFLMVAIIQNTQNRSDRAVHKKLNAIAQGLSDVMANIDYDGLEEDVNELQEAVGLEKRESS